MTALTGGTFAAFTRARGLFGLRRRVRNSLKPWSNPAASATRRVRLRRAVSKMLTVIYVTGRRCKIKTNGFASTNRLLAMIDYQPLRRKRGSFDGCDPT